MHKSLFISGPLPTERIVGVYDLNIVLLSFIIACAASYVALDIASKLVREKSEQIKKLWHIAGSVTLGIGIWSMHFIGMLAYKTGMEFNYSFWMTLFSLIIPIGFSFLVFDIIKQHVSPSKILIAAPFLGIGIAAMHYSGMAAMDMKASLQYIPGLFVLSIVIAIIASAGALWLAVIASRTKQGSNIKTKLGSAIIMGAAICGMHYVGMKAAVIVPYAGCRFDSAFDGQNTMLALSITVITLLVLGIASAALVLNQKVTEHLQDEIEKRTVELKNNADALQVANEQLLAAKESAEAASIAKSEFLANMSHEIRTPMNAVVGISSLLSSNSLPEQKKAQYLSTLQTSAETLLQLIDELLDISKIDVNKIELENINFNLKELVDEVISLLTLRAQEKKISLSLEYSNTLAKEFIGDPLRIRQILVNILSNAVKFTEKGGVTITIEGKPLTGTDKTTVSIKVVDTGVGITPAKQKTIFDKFSQEDSSTTRKYGGSGLGLAIAKGLVDRMDGTIELKSVKDKGSEFLIKLPLTRKISNIAASQKMKQIIPKEPDLSDAVKSKQVAKPILLVEDYAANILVASTYLKNLGYEYEIASNGREAIEKHGKSRFKLILMDIQMPEMDGYEATKIIRSREAQMKNTYTPIIAMTSHARADDWQKCKEAGMDEFIAKPFKEDELKLKIETFLESQDSNYKI